MRLEALGLLAGLALAGPVLADSAPAALQPCQAAKPAERVKACTAAIKSDKLKGTALAMAYGLRARGLAAGGDVEAAIADLDAALKAEPGASDLLYQRGMAHLAREEYAKALADFDAVLKLAPNDADSLYHRAWALAQLGRDEAAVRDLDAVLKTAPLDNDIRLDRGGLLLRLGRLQPAITDFTALIKAEPKAAAAYFNRGRAFYLAGDFARAAVDFRAAWQIRADNPYAALRLYLAELHLGRDDPAPLRASLAKFPTEQWPLPLIAAFLGETTMEEVIRALNFKDKALEAQFRREAAFYFGERERARGRTAEAKALLTQAADPPRRDAMESVDASYVLKGMK